MAERQFMPSDNIGEQNYYHRFHIPVMGTGFTIDSPLRVAKFGISSVISIGDDILIEQMRKFHSEKNNLPYEAIDAKEDDSRARRITAYLNLVDLVVKKQIEELKNLPFEDDTDISKYFRMLPDSDLKDEYTSMLNEKDQALKLKLQNDLRNKILPGSIDVNIMSKIDRDKVVRGVTLPPEQGIAMSAFRGFALSTLRSSIVFSAGMNRRLYNYISSFEDFLPDEKGCLKKKITLKVSDFRSAYIQGKLLAKSGVWVSEYRIESGLNCGGHAFATKGQLMGPILDEFKIRRDEFVSDLYEYYKTAIARKGFSPKSTPYKVYITAQGGIGTFEENEFLIRHYDLFRTGWGTPFLLVPEVTNVDDDHLEKLAAADEKDIQLSENSPLGIPFWNLKTSSAEKNRLKAIEDGKPGSSCPKGFLSFNTEFTKKELCTASHAYQKMKLKSISKQDLSFEKKEALKKYTLTKACLCRDLAGGVLSRNKIEPNPLTTICCGPGIVNFSKVTTLEKMTDHIYGRVSLLSDNNRPHMFIKELQLYYDYIISESEKASIGMVEKTSAYFSEFIDNINSGIDYYKKLAQEFSENQREQFLRDLDSIRLDIEDFYSRINMELSIGLSH